MTDPFDADAGAFLVLVNADGQHSLWPAPVKVPAGWTVAAEPASREDCLAWVEAHWTDMRPKSQAAALAERD